MAPNEERQKSAAESGSWATTDYSTRPGVQSYKDVYGDTAPHPDGLRLKDVLVQLGEEIREAQWEAAHDGKEDLLRIKECQVELAVTWEVKGSGGVEFWVVKLGGELNRSNTQTITITLEPTEEGQKPVTVSRREIG